MDILYMFSLLVGHKIRGTWEYFLTTLLVSRLFVSCQNGKMHFETAIFSSLIWNPPWGIMCGRLLSSPRFVTPDVGDYCPVYTGHTIIWRKCYGQQYDDAGQTQDKDFMLLRFCKLLNSVKRKADKVCLAFTTHIMLIEIQSIPSFSFLLTGKPLKKSEWKTLSPDTLHPYALWNIKMGNFSLMLDTLLPKEIWNIFYIFFFCSKGIFTDSERLYMKN